MPSLLLEISQGNSASVQASKYQDGSSDIIEQGKMLAEDLHKATVIQLGQRCPNMAKKENNSVLHTLCSRRVLFYGEHKQEFLQKHM